MTLGVSLGHGKVLRRSWSGLALEVQFKDFTRWIPLSVIHDDSEVYDGPDGKEGNVVVFESWANSKGLSDVGTKGKDKWQTR